MLKALVLSLGLAGVVQAATLTLPVNVLTNLPSCGGTVQTSKNGNQVNLVFRDVKDCSNFDILSTTFGLLDAGYQKKKIPQSSNGTRSGSFTIPQIYIDRGLNAIQVVVKSNSGAHSDTINLVFVVGPQPRPFPQPRPHPIPSGSLRGYCPDNDHTEFRQAKAYAYSLSGLNLSDSAATQWALDYVQNHRCGTISEYQSRFTALKAYAYGISYLNLSDSDARDFALRHAETTRASDVQAWMSNFPLIKELYYGISYLNRDASVSAKLADEWVRRGYCGGASEISGLKSEFRKHYQFAYSISGLNLDAKKSGDYALGKIRHSSNCPDLLQ